jgi:phosphomethylpyrimidine synthase
VCESAKRFRNSPAARRREYEWEKAKVTAALTAEQQEILEKRGVLSPEEIHRLASKTRRTMGAEAGKASCHSDLVVAEKAQLLQFVELGTRE